MSYLKYQVGDLVRVKSRDWYFENCDKYGYVLVDEDYLFRPDDVVWCNHVLTIGAIHMDEYYTVEEDGGKNRWTDGMIEGLIKPIFNIDDTVETYDGLTGYIDKVEYNKVKGCFEYYVSFIVDGKYYKENQLKPFVKPKTKDNIEFETHCKILFPDTVDASNVTINGNSIDSLSLCDSCIFAVNDNKPHCGLRGFRTDFNVDNCSAYNETSQLPDGFELQEDGYFSWVNKPQSNPQSKIFELEVPEGKTSCDSNCPFSNNKLACLHLSETKLCSQYDFTKAIISEAPHKDMMRFHKEITNEEMVDLLSQFPKDAVIAVECCNPRTMKYNKEDNSIRID